MAILAQLQRLFSPRPDKLRAQHLYIALVEQARNPVFYTAYGVPDTLDGRFEMITLHMHLVLQRLSQGFDRMPELRELSRLLIETYFADMDQSLREMGVGDTGIARKVQKISGGFYGRLEAYGMASENPALWPEALRRNVYGTCDIPDAEHIFRLQGYATVSHAVLAELDDRDLNGNILAFAPPESLASTTPG